ncbi:hypothetical protein [Pelagicoccus sp. SDUM812002]|uniref:alpha-L-rhamnosidase-related protein n=1 Tax=Pelagicoccus sp. SDUM812002 TaxID=3041266 RepID=UPI00280ED333|nr:hypothetical protein [Pelagicoccus sp. SDUM812002]MDQ8188390.1 hypothetical protein [Pelagicoccus sp. SDUM812002]
MTISPPPKFVWYNSHGEGRNRFAYFRRSFELDQVPSEFGLCLFSDTVYQLFVNGQFVQFGPARFDVRNPQFDEVDIASYLREGRNVVAVLAKSFGCKTFKDNSVRGGFVAWGELPTGNGSHVSFATGERSEWKVRKCDAYDSTALKMSFALDAIDIFDQSKDLEGWNEAEFDDQGWAAPTELESQDTWGELEPRSIPFMNLTEVPYEITRPVSPLSPAEKVYGFSVEGSHFHGEEHIFEGRNKMSIGVSTWIYSPRQQSVVVGLFWGSYYLNGEECDDGLCVDGLRKNTSLPLREGWNSFFASELFLDDCLTFLMGIPQAAELQLSPNKKYNDDVAWARTQVLPPETLEARLEKKVPQPLDDSFDADGGWVEVSIREMDANPARRSMWDSYAPPFSEIDSEQLEGHLFPIEEYPQGFSLFLEFESMELVLPRITILGAAGATIDFAYSEHLSEDGYHLDHTIVYQAGDRVLANDNVVSYMSSQPRGARYMRITVRGAAEDVRIKSLRFLSGRYPVQRLGRFSCSDALLSEVWTFCERTQYANMEDAFVDCSGRERGMYLRDTIIQFHNTLVACGDTKLMGRCMQLFGQSPDETGKFRAVYPNKGDYTIADFAIEAIDGYWQYYLNTGDIERLRSDWPAMLGSIAWFNDLSDEREDGLLDADWPQLREVNAHYGGLHGDNGVEDSLMDKTGPSACLTFPYIKMLSSAAEIAIALGKPEEAQEFEVRRTRITKSARELLWNSQKSCYNDNLTGTTQSYHASILAVLADVATPSQIGAIRNRFRSEFTNVFINGYDPEDGAHFSPAYSFFIFQGLYKLGLADLAESFIKEGWGWMLANGAPTALEFFRKTASHCHAWSASPMYYLSKYALGVSFPKAPDLSQVKIDIQSDLDWAKGTYPVPGTDKVIAVEWKRNSEGIIEAVVQTPAGFVLTWDRSRMSVRQIHAPSEEPASDCLAAPRRAV